MVRSSFQLFRIGSGLFDDLEIDPLTRLIVSRTSSDTLSLTVSRFFAPKLARFFLFSIGLSIESADAQSHLPMDGSIGLKAIPPLLVLCSILYQRGIYPPESFRIQKKYGLSMMVTSEDALERYITNVLEQMSGATHPVVESPLLRAQSESFHPFYRISFSAHSMCGRL